MGGSPASPAPRHCRPRLRLRLAVRCHSCGALPDLPPRSTGGVGSGFRSRRPRGWDAAGGLPLRVFRARGGLSGGGSAAVQPGLPSASARSLPGGQRSAVCLPGADILVGVSTLAGAVRTLRSPGWRPSCGPTHDATVHRRGARGAESQGPAPPAKAVRALWGARAGGGARARLPAAESVRGRPRGARSAVRSSSGGGGWRWAGLPPCRVGAPCGLVPFSGLLRGTSFQEL